MNFLLPQNPIYSAGGFSKPALGGMQSFMAPAGPKQPAQSGPMGGGPQPYAGNTAQAAGQAPNLVSSPPPPPESRPTLSAPNGYFGGGLGFTFPSNGMGRFAGDLTKNKLYGGTRFGGFDPVTGETMYPENKFPAHPGDGTVGGPAPPKNPQALAAYYLNLQAQQQAGWRGLTGGAGSAYAKNVELGALQDYARELEDIRRQRHEQLWNGISGIAGLAGQGARMAFGGGF